MLKPAIVLDTNILISRLLLPKSKPASVVDWVIRHGELLMSNETMGELAEVLSRKKFNRYVSLEDRKKFIMKLARFISIVPITKRIELCRDPKDNMFLEVAVNGGARVIVSGDKDLLSLKQINKIPICTAEVFNQKYTLVSEDN